MNSVSPGSDRGISGVARVCRNKAVTRFAVFSSTGLSPPHTHHPHSPTYLLTPQGRVRLDKLTSSQLVRKYPAFHGTRRFITAFTSARQMSLSWARSIQSMFPQTTFWRSSLILSSHLFLGLPNGLFPSDFPTKTSPLLQKCYMPRPSHSPFDQPNIWWAVQIIKLLIV